MPSYGYGAGIPAYDGGMKDRSKSLPGHRHQGRPACHLLKSFLLRVDSSAVKARGRNKSRRTALICCSTHIGSAPAAAEVGAQSKGRVALAATAAWEIAMIQEHARAPAEALFKRKEEAQIEANTRRGSRRCGKRPRGCELCVWHARRQATRRRRRH